MMDFAPIITGLGVLLGGVSLHEMWRAWHARRGRTERHLATVHADGVEAMMQQLLARVNQLEQRDNECQRRVSALGVVVERQRRRIAQLERQLQQAGIDVSLTDDIPYYDQDTPTDLSTV